MKSQSSGSRKRSSDKAATAKAAKAFHNHAMSYSVRVDRALDAWTAGNLTLASRELGILSTHKCASDTDKLNYSEMSIGCKILAGERKSPGDVYAECSRCGHPRFWHVLQVACIQCLDYHTQESKCRAFVPCR